MDPEQHTPTTEYGGADGAVQPPPHELKTSERNAAQARAALTPGGIDPVTGLDADAMQA